MKAPTTDANVLAELRPPGGWYTPADAPTGPGTVPMSSSSSATAGSSASGPGTVSVSSSSSATAGSSATGPDPAPVSSSTPDPTPDRYVPPPVIRQRAQAGEWLTRAACRGMDPELFFPDRGESTQPAKAACSACPVRVECLDYALTNAERFGIWGGTSERERRAIRRAQARAARADRGTAA